MSFSVVIPTYNRPNHLFMCLNALRKEISSEEPVDIHVIDDGSREDMHIINERHCIEYRVNYHYNKSNCGASVARNTGIAKSKNQWIAFLDDDVIVEEGWYNKAKTATTSCAENIAGIEGRVVPSGNGLWDSEVSNNNGGLFLTCHIIYRKTSLLEIGCFDEAFNNKVPSCEDQELAARIQLRGNDIMFMHDLTVTHLPRSINLIEYLLRSFTRIYGLIADEWHFYNRHPSRYHLFRYSTNFVGTFISILLKHTIITLRRRKTIDLVLHPVQFFFLFFSLLLEQLAAWIFLPSFLIRYFRKNGNGLYKDIDLKKSAVLYDTRDIRSFYIFRIPVRIINRITFNITHKPAYDSSTILRRASKYSKATNPNIFLRIDDFFYYDNKDDVYKFCDIIAEEHAPFLAAFSGKDLMLKDILPILTRVHSIGGMIALHGFSHTGKFGPYQSEVLQMSLKDIDRMFVKVNEANLPDHLYPAAFIPPFNAISWDQIVYMGKHVPIICGGPETARFTERILGPVVLKNGAIYFPSYFPFYQSADKICRQNIFNLTSKLSVPFCITLHLSVEAKNDFIYTKKLIHKLRPKLASWASLLEERSDI